MNCPLCIDRSLEPVFRSGIEIDVCPNCKGMWLDRGELEKLAGSPDPSPRDAVGFEPVASAGGARSDGMAKSGDKAKPDKAKPDKGKKKRKKSFAERLGDVLEEVIDL